MTKVYGIVGWPVWHTLSPAMHNAAFQALGLDAVYVPFPVPPNALRDALRGFTALGIQGANVTLPHKQSIVDLLDDVQDDARAVGAVNTIALRSGKLVGLNTDGEGLVRALHEQRFDPKDTDIVVLGAGGAARAAVAGLSKAGAAHIRVVARREPRATALVSALDPIAGNTRLTASGFSTEERARAFAGAHLLVQATSATLDDGPDASQFAASLPLDRLDRSAVVTDLVYTPRQTAVLRAAAAQDLKTVDGAGMLLHQGAIAFEQWTGRDAPLEVMRKALA